MIDLNIEKKYKCMILVIIVSVLLYLVLDDPKVFYLASAALLIFYFWSEYSNKTEGYMNISPNYNGTQKRYNELFENNQETESVSDPNIKAKIFNDWGKFFWDRNWEVKNTSPFGFCSKPNDSVSIAEWCYGLKPEINITKTENGFDKSIRVHDTCKNGSIYMNQPQKAAFDRLTCKGHF